MTGKKVTASGPGAIAAGESLTHASTRVGDDHYHGVEILPLSVATLNYSQVLAAAGLDRFVGRQWLLDTIEKRLSGREGRYVLVAATAGVGKTAFAAWLSERWRCPRHFTQVVGGGDTRTALQSLAAQLITRYGLEEEFAPGGRLPGWAGDPARFPAILAAAAEMAATAGEPLRIVVDGLDEATAERALGLPSTLPDGVQIVATYREGVPVTRLPAGEQVSVARFAAEDPANLEDVRQFLAVRARTEPLSTRLAAAGITESQFVERLLDRSGGVWVYLRYMVLRLEDGEFDVSALDGLPKGLTAYYRREVTASWDDALFHTQDLVLLTTLATAAQPVTAAQLTRLTKLDPGVIRQLCNHRYRPFLAIDTADLDRAPSYAIHHSSLRDFLHGDTDPADPEADPVAEADLRQAAREAHHRFADLYLAEFGGLAGGLPSLQANRELADVDDRYPLYHLPMHLHRAGRHDELQQLLTCVDRFPAMTTGTLWADVHDRAGTLDDYLASIALGRAVAEERTDAQIAAGRPARDITLESEYAMLAAVLVGRAKAVPTALLPALVRVGMWDTRRALAHVNRIADPQRRAKDLLAMLPLLQDADEARDARDEVLAAVRAVESAWSRADLLAELSRFLTGDQLDHVLDLIRADEHEETKVVMLARSAATAPLDDATRSALVDEVLDLTAGLEYHASETQAKVLALVIDLLDDAQLERAVDIARNVYFSDLRAEALAVVSRRLTGEAGERAMREAVEMAGQIYYLHRRGRVLAGMFAFLRGPLLAQAWQAITEIDHVPYQAEAATLAAGHLSGPLRDEILDLVVAAYDQVSRIGEFNREPLALAATLLTEPAKTRELTRVLNSLDREALTEMITSEDQRRHGVRVLRTISGHLNADQVEKLIRTIVSLEYEQHRTARAEALIRMAAHLGGPRRAHAVHHSAADIATISDLRFRAPLGIGVSAHLTGPARDRALDQALDDISSFTLRDTRLTLLAAVAPHVDAGRLERVMTSAANADATGSTADRLREFRDLLDGPAGIRVLDDGEIRRAIGDPGVQMRESTLADIVAPLGAAARRDLLNLAVQAAIAVDDARFWSWVVTGLAAQDNAAELLDRTVETARAIRSERSRAGALAALAPSLPPAARAPLVDEVLDAATEPSTVLLVLPVVQEAQLGRAVEVVKSAPNSAERAEALTVLAARVTSPEIEALALDAVDSLTFDHDRTTVMVRAIAHLDRHQRPQAAEHALGRIRDEGNEIVAVKALTVLAAHLSADQLTAAVELAMAVNDKAVFTAVALRIGALASEMTIDQTAGLLRRLWRAVPRYEDLVAIIGAAAPATLAIGGPEALAHQATSLT
ncbi:hypothetical protein LCL61_23900 [Amycolatopsis coloradensis]|uniref:Uncharacterized protein n=1 Tax=Amycolatopsis coloradensis TaxID=76021 RepID=A0ACD5BH35_9PSEU